MEEEQLPLPLPLPLPADPPADPTQTMPAAGAARMAPHAHDPMHPWDVWDVFVGRQAHARLDAARRLPPQVRRELQRLAARGEAALRRLVAANLRLVAACAREVVRGAVTDDVLQEGAIGLIIAAQRYDPRRGTRFSTYAYPWIRQALQRSAGRDCTIPLPTYLAEEWRTILQAVDACAGDLHAAARQAAARIAARNTASARKRAAALTPARLHAALAIAAPPASLDQRRSNGDDDGAPLGDCLVAPGATPEDVALRRIISAEVRTLVAGLPERERHAIVLRFFAGVAPDERARRLGVTPAQARTLEERALRLLRAAAEQRGLHDALA